MRSAHKKQFTLNVPNVVKINQSERRILHLSNPIANKEVEHGGFNVGLELRKWAISDSLGFIPEDDPET